MMVRTPAAARTPQSIPLADTVRVMVEAADQEQALTVANRLADVVKAELALA